MDAPRDGTAPVGLDGLTSEQLAASRRGFWDEHFTELLLRRVPEGATRLVDVGCGLATAAHALLPALPAARYVGLDADPARLRDAERLLEGTAYRDRVELLVGRAEALPCADASADVALVSMTLQHLTDPVAALAEIRRVLARGGRLVAVEPDNLNNVFYFDGLLADATSAFRRLVEVRRRAYAPADAAVGPRVASLAERAGLEVLDVVPHALGPVRKQTARQFLDRVRQAARIVGAGLDSADALDACLAEVDRAEATLGADTPGYACQCVTVFICVARRSS